MGDGRRYHVHMKIGRYVDEYGFEAAVATYAVIADRIPMAVVLLYIVLTNVALRRRVNHLRATVRTFEAVNRVRWEVVLRKLGVTDEERAATANAVEAALGDEDVQSLHDDIRLASGR